jgi:hypothetical protein
MIWISKAYDQRNILINGGSSVLLDRYSQQNF